MTHTLHRRGSINSLSEDYIVLAMSAKDINEEGSGTKLKRIFEILTRYSLVNFGDMKTGNMFTTKKELILNNIHERSIIHAVFKNNKDLELCLKELKEKNLGISIVATGLFERLHRCCRDAGIEPYAIEHSLGVHGKKDNLPDIDILEITTMCGHGMVSANLVKKMIADVKSNFRTYENAAEELAKQCCCGIFNPHRAARLLEKAAIIWIT